MTDTVIQQSLKDQVRSTAVGVSTSATLLPAARLNYRKSISLKNPNTTTVYLGGSDVSTSNGFPIRQNEAIDIDLHWDSLIYAIASTGTQTVRVLEFS